MTALFNLVRPWLSESDSEDLDQLYRHVVWLQNELFNEYEPNRYESFDDRVAEWLLNVAGEDERKTLFRLLRHLFFVGKRQFDSLCRAAHSDQIRRWIVDQAGLDVVDPDISKKVEARLEATWFCPLTDSMRINSFLKLNNIKGHGLRPDWHSLKHFGDPAKIRDYIAIHSIERLVLLEDFVGTGDQMLETAEWAATSFPALPILLVPLVCCPQGLETGTNIRKLHGNVEFSPVLTLQEELFVTQAPQLTEPTIFASIRQLAIKYSTRMDEWAALPFGYGGTGALVALYSNCPDNSLPLMHHKGRAWAPLFSRIRRG